MFLETTRWRKQKNVWVVFGFTEATQIAPDVVHPLPGDAQIRKWKEQGGGAIGA